MREGWEYKKLDSCAYIEYGTRVVQKKMAEPYTPYMVVVVRLLE